MLREFCKQAKCAKLTVNEGSTPLIFISKAPPLTVEESEEEEEFTHVMSSPIDGREFPFLIKGVEFISGFWHCNAPQGAGLIRLPCPMPGTYPYVDVAGGVELEKGRETSDLYWEGNKLYCYFEAINRRQWSNYYPNNRGTCTYKISGIKGGKIYDRQGILYKSSPDKDFTYEIECDACCKDNEILCDHHHYPGYKCYPIPPTASRLLRGQNDIARYWRYRG